MLLLSQTHQPTNLPTLPVSSLLPLPLSSIKVSSVGLKFPGDFDVPKFNMFMSTLLQVESVCSRVHLLLCS